MNNQQKMDLSVAKMLTDNRENPKTPEQLLEHWDKIHEDCKPRFTFKECILHMAESAKTDISQSDFAENIGYIGKKIVEKTEYAKQLSTLVEGTSEYKDCYNHFVATCKNLAESVDTHWQFLDDVYLAWQSELPTKDFDPSKRPWANHIGEISDKIN